MLTLENNLAVRRILQHFRHHPTNESRSCMGPQPRDPTQPNPTRFLGWVGLRLKKCWVGLGSAKRPKKTQVLGSSASERCMESRCAFSYFALPRGVRLLIANRMCTAYWRLFANERSSPTVVIGWPDLALEIIGLG